MKRISLLIFFVGLMTGCSVKTKDAVYQHQGRTADQIESAKNNEQGTYKRAIDTQAFYQKAIDKKADSYMEIVKPLSQIVLNTQHLDDPYMYRRKDLAYSLQLFQSNYLVLLKKDPSRVSEITEKYLKFLSYKCTDNFFTDCKSHKFLIQDSNTSAILLAIGQNEKSLEKRLHFLKLAVALQNSANGDSLKKEIFTLLFDYIKKNTEIVTDNHIQSIKMKLSSDSSNESFKSNLVFFQGALKTFNIANEELTSLQSLLIYRGIDEVLGSEMYNFLFAALSGNQSKDGKIQNALTEQWFKILSLNESSNALSWKNLKSGLPANIKIDALSLEDIKKKGLNALLIYQVAQDLSAQKSLNEIENKKEIILKNPDLAYQIFEMQLKLHFFSLAQKSFGFLKAELQKQKNYVSSPQELLDVTLQGVNPHLRALWMGYEKSVGHYMYFISQTFGSTSEIAMKFRRTQENIDTSLKVYVTTPMMLMMLFQLDKKQYKEKLRFAGFSGSTAELSAPLLLVEVLQGRMPSFFYVKEGVKDTPLTQYQVLYAMAYAVIMDLPRYFGDSTEVFVNAFSKVNMKIPEERMKEVETHLEKIGFGSFDSNQRYSRKEGNVHDILKLCENPGSITISNSIDALRYRTFLGKLDTMSEKDLLFRNLAIYNQNVPGNMTISEMIEFVRSELDPIIDTLAILEKVTNVTLQDRTNLQNRRQKILARAFELEEKVSECALKINRLEKERQNRFLQAEYNYIRSIIAISNWIENKKETPFLAEAFKKNSGASKQARIDFAQDWLLKTVYAPLQFKSHNLYEELKNFKFFEINEQDQSLKVNSRSIDLYYRLALWAEEPAQQKEVRLSLSYPETFKQLLRTFYSYNTANFEADTIIFNPNSGTTEKELRQSAFKNLSNWDIGRVYQTALKDILRLKISRWKMADSVLWSASSWVNCKNDCLAKRQEKTEKRLLNIIETNLSMLSHFQIEPDQVEDLKAISVLSHMNQAEQIKDFRQYNVNPDELFTFHSANITTSASSVKYMGLLDYLFRFTTSHYLGSRPLYSLHGEIFKGSGRDNQSEIGNAENNTMALTGKDLIGRREVLLDFQDEKGLSNEGRIVALSLIGQSLQKSSEEQFLLPLPENLDREMRYYVVAPTIRELELRDTFYKTIEKLESTWKKPVLNFALNNEPMNDPWLVSSSYLGRVQEQEREFHRLTKGVFELKKWHSAEAK